MREREDPTQVVPRDLAYFLPSKTSQRLAIQVPVVDTNVVCRTAYHCGASSVVRRGTIRRAGVDAGSKMRSCRPGDYRRRARLRRRRGDMAFLAVAWMAGRL